MIAYEELVAALDRYVARKGGTPTSVHAPAAPAAYDEPRDPDLPSLSAYPEDDATHVGHADAPSEDRPHEIDIGDVRADEEL